MITEVAVVAPGHIRTILPTLVVMLFACAAIAAILYFASRDRHAAIAEQGNPADLKMAMTFAGLYALVSFVVAATKDEFGVQALYPVVVLSGLTDMDAITLSTSQLVNQGRLEATMAWRLILVASLANLVFKAGIVSVIGGRALLRYVVPAFGGALLVGVVLLWLWPTA